MPKEKIIIESKEDQEKFKNWILNNTSQKFILDDDKEMFASNLVKNFIFLKPRIKSPYNDFYYWMKNSTPDDLKKYVDELLKQHREKTALKDKEKDGARLVYSDNDWKVYEITNYEASAKYGKNTKWCISGSKEWENGENGEKFFDGYYNQNGIKFYFFIKSNNEKWALAVYPNNEYCEIFNAEDVKVAFIPGAPEIPEIKVKYNDNSDSNILVNAIMSGQLNEKLLIDLMADVITENTGEMCSIFNNPDDMIYFVEEYIPEGYLEYEAVESGAITPEEYEEITGEEYIEGGWTGDIPAIDLNDIGSFDTKDEYLDRTVYEAHKFWVCSETDSGYGYSVYNADDWVHLYLLGNLLCRFQEWPESDVADFYGNPEGGSRADMLGVCMANLLIDKIKKGEVSKSDIENIGLSQEYLASLGESLKESREDFFKNSVVRDASGNLLPVYHCSFSEFDAFAIDDEDGSLERGDWRGEFGFAWFAEDENYAQNYGDGEEYECYLNITKPLDIGELNDEVEEIDGVEIKDDFYDEGTTKVSHEFIRLCKLVKVQPEEMIKWYHKWWETGYIFDLTRRAFFKNLVVKLGYDGVIATEGGNKTWGCVRANQVKLISNENPTDKDNMKEDLSKEQEDFFKDSVIRDKQGNLIPMWHGTNVQFSEFNRPINWFSTSKEYAKQYAEWLGGTPTYYEAYLNCKKPFNCGDTSARVFDLSPIKPYKLSRESIYICRKLGIDEEDFRRLVKQTSAETKEDEYKLKLHTITRLGDFAKLVSNAGYDSILARENGYPCVGVLNPEDIKRVNNSKPTTSRNIDEEIIPYAESGVEPDFSQDDIIAYAKQDPKHITFGLSEGASIVLSDGTTINVTAFDTHGLFAGCVYSWTADLKDLGADEFGNPNEPDWDGDADSDAMDHMYSLGVVTLNDGSSWLEERRKIVFEGRPTERQFDVIRDFIDMVQMKSKASDELYVYTGTDFQRYKLGDYTSDEIIKKIKKSFVTGRLEEDNDDYNPEDDDYDWDEYNKDDVVEVNGMYEVDLNKIDLSDIESLFSGYLTTECEGMNGPVYIFPDGTFLDIMNDYGDRDYIHYDIAFDVINNFYNVPSDIEENSVGSVMDCLESKFGMIRCNGGEGNSEDRTYVAIGKQPTEDQYEALEKYFYNLWQTLGKSNVSINIEVSGFKNATFEFDKIQPEGIIKAIKRYFVSGQLLNEKNYKLPTKTYDFDGDKVVWDKDAEDYIYWGSEADKWAEDYAKSYKVQMSPKDFLDLTTQKGADSLKKGDNLGFGELRDLDKDEFNKWIHQPIFLQIAFRDKNHPQRAQVTGHEGRHRMFALMQAGYKSVDVELSCEVWDTSYDKYHPFKADFFQLIGQFNKNVMVQVYNPIPLSWKQHKSIRPNLKDENLNEYLDTVKADDNSTYPVYATDSVYQLKNLLTKGDKAYRIYNDDETYYFQDAAGDKTHFDMLDLALHNGWLANSKLRYGDNDDLTSGSIHPEDYDEGYMVFIPFNYDRELRYHTRLGEDNYYDCRVYDFGVMFTRSSEAYENGLFKALGDPNKQIYYDSWYETASVRTGNQTRDFDVDLELNGDPNVAISTDVMKMRPKADAEASRDAKMNSKIELMKKYNVPENFYKYWDDAKGLFYALNHYDLSKDVRLAISKYLNEINDSKVPHIEVEESLKPIDPENEDMDYGAIYTKNVYELKHYIDDCIAHGGMAGLRVVYFPDEDIWAFGDSWDNTHADIIQDMYSLQGINSRGKEPVRLMVYTTEENDEEMIDYFDIETNIYQYPGIKVCDLGYDFKSTPLYKEMGKPERVYQFEQSQYSEGLKESLKKLDKYDEIYYTSSAKEILDYLNSEGYCRFIYFKPEDLYVASNNYIHDDLGKIARRELGCRSNEYQFIYDVSDSSYLENEVEGDTGCIYIYPEFCVYDRGGTNLTETSLYDYIGKESDIVNIENLDEKIVKKGSKWQVQSEKGKNLGTYDTKEEAEDRLKDVEMFKHMKESLNESKQDIEKFRHWAGDELADRFFKLKDRLPDRAKDIYYWMSMEKQLLNLKDRYKDAQENSNISNYEQWAHENSINGLKLALDNIEQTPTRREVDRLGKEGSEKIYEDDNWLVLKINTYEASVKYGKGTEWCITGNNSDQGRADFNHHTQDSNATIYFFINKKNKLHKYALEYVNDNDWCLFDETDFPHVGYGKSFERGVNSMGGEHWYKGDSKETFPVIKGLPDINKAYNDFENMDESLKEENNLNVLDALDKEFGQEEVYMWSTYILPNGHFLNPDNNIEYFKQNGFNFGPAYEHCDFEDWAVDNGYGRDLSPVYDNCIKMNVTYPYLSMPDKAKPTQEQLNAIRKILDRKDLFEPEGKFYWYDIFPEEKVDSKGENLLAVYTPVGDELFDLDVSDADDIIRAINQAYVRGGFFTESLNEEVDKYYRLELEDPWGGRSGLILGAFEMIPTKETIEEFPEDFEELTDDERRTYYEIDRIISKLSEIKCPAVDAKNIFAFTKEAYERYKEDIKYLQDLVSKIGMKIIINEVDVDDLDIDYKDDDQIAFDAKKYNPREITESKADWEKFRQWCNDDSLYNLFISLQKRLGDLKDIYWWMKNSTPEKLYDYLHEIQSSPSKKQKEKNAKEGAKLLYDANGWKVYEITTYEAAVKYGKNTTWCISGNYDSELGYDYWSDYADNKVIFYIKGNEKWAVIVDGSYFTIWDELDNKVAYIPGAPQVDGLPDVSKYQEDTVRAIVQLYNVKPSDIEDIKNALDDSELSEFFYDYDTREAYEVVLKDGSTRFMYWDGPQGYFMDVTDEMMKWAEEYM